MPSIDIAVPNYNYGHFMRQCVANILSQNIEDMRILIIDNASTDNSVEIAEQLAAKDPRIELRVHSENLGAVASFNEGVDWASADYYAMLSVDDLFPAGTLKCAIDVLQANPEAVFAYGSYIPFQVSSGAPSLGHVDDPREWRITPGDDYVARCCRKLIFCHAPVVRTRIQKKVHYRPHIRQAPDLEVYMRLALHGPVAETKSVQAFQGIHDKNITSAVWKDQTITYQTEQALFDTFFSTEGAAMKDAAKLHEIARSNTGKRAYWSACASFAKGRHEEGRKLIAKAHELCPRTRLIPPIDYLLTYADLNQRIMRHALSMLGRFNIFRHVGEA